MTLVGIPLGIAIGLVLGLVGAGGALLATPLLVLAGNFSFLAASTGALFVVFFASIAALLTRGVAPGIFKRALLAVFLGTAGSIPGAWLSGVISEVTARYVLMAVLLTAAILSWNSHKVATRESSEVATIPMVGLFVFAGFLTGLTGVGGGFILIPGIVRILKLHFHEAVSLSLLVVTGNSLIALATRLLSGVTFTSEELPTVAIVVISAVVGSVVGASMSSKLNRKLIQRSFSMLALVLIAVLAYELSFEVLAP